MTERSLWILLCRDADRAQEGPLVSAPQRLGSAPADSKAASWNCLESCSCTGLPFDADAQLGSSVPLPGAPSMWLLCDGFISAWWLGSQGKDPRGGRTWLKLDHLRGLRRHPASPPAHGFTEADLVCPGLERRGDRLRPLVGMAGFYKSTCDQKYCCGDY